MSIRISKVTRDFNVGIATVVDFLRKKGFEVEANPNTKISDQEYDLLVKEFSQDKSQKVQSEIVSLQRQKEKKESVTPPVDQEPVEVKTEISDDLIPRFKPVGKIDLDNLYGKKNTAVKTQQELVKEKAKEIVLDKAEIVELQTPKEVAPIIVKEEPKVTVVVVQQTEKEIEVEAPQSLVVEKVAIEPIVPQVKKEEPIVEPEPLVTPVISSDEIYKVERQETPQVKVIGTVDLSLINQNTRPARKTKEEKKQEQESKNRQKVEPHRTLAKPVLATANSIDDKKKRARIKKDKVDINSTVTQQQPSNNFNRPVQPNNRNRGNNPNNNATHNRSNNAFRGPIKPAVTEEEVQQQVKETLARLTSKSKGKGSKYRKDKRESHRQQEEMSHDNNGDVLKLTEFVTANELASMMNIQVTQVISTCMSIGIMVSINQRLDAETINIVADEFGFKTEYVSAEVVDAITVEQDNPEDLIHRPPIVTVMGHVDHGKTSLLDYIRSANVIAGEAGGITQHIGAYNVTLEDGREITFLDTPGHEAFTAMRARGAKVTDIAIIIVAADDSVMPQTIEAINHASAAGVPIVFAINKIDKPHANPEKIKEALSAMNYLVEDWGGKYQSQELSAKTGKGIAELMEKVLLEAEMLDLKANPNKRALGSIIESTLDKGRGYVATVLVQNGTLKVGDIVLAGTNYGRVKAMFNERNQRVQEAAPSEPVLILGLNGAPTAGDLFHVLETDQEAREIAGKREQLQREQGLRTQKLLTLDDIGRRIAIGNFQELNVIIKGDVDGSIEALADALIKLSTEQIQVRVIHQAVGQISESDVTLAAASNAIILGFQVRPSQAARKYAESEGVDIRLYSVIYKAIEEIKDAMEGMLSPEIVEEITGTAEIQMVYRITKVGTVAGCLVREGKIKRGNKCRVIRDGIVIFTGELGSLKRFKDDVKEVVHGYECGLNINNYNDIKEGDFIESFEEVEVKQKL